MSSLPIVDAAAIRAAGVSMEVEVAGEGCVGDMGLSAAIDLGPVEVEVAGEGGVGDMGLPAAIDLGAADGGVETVDLLTAPDREFGPGDLEAALEAALQNDGVLPRADAVAPAQLGVDVPADADAATMPGDPMSEAARVNAVFAEVKAATVRPHVVIPHTAPAHPPQLADSEGQPSVAVPADGLCFYHSGVACRGLREWWLTHSPDSGLGYHLETRRRDVANAQEMRDAVMQAAAEALCAFRYHFSATDSESMAE